MAARHAPNAQYPLFIPTDLLEGFDDLFMLRDPGGRAGRPGLRLRRYRGSARLQVVGRFNIVHDYRIRRRDGIRFVEATGDENPIHREDRIVPGAMTASKILLPLEILFPRMALDELGIKYRQIAAYGRRTRNIFRVRPEADGGVDVHVSTYQAGRIVADTRLEGRILPEPPRTSLARRKVNVAQVEKVRSFLHALKIRPQRYFCRLAEHDYTYPLAYITSLPSGVMVRDLQGEGGLLNKLSLEFKGRRIPISGRAPEVQLGEPRLRRTFSRVVTRIVEGLQTVYEGTALVMSGGQELLEGMTEAAPQPRPRFA